jgi:hypothetical protein
MEELIKDLKAKQFTVEDMVNFATAMMEKPNFDETSVEIWYNKRKKRVEDLLRASKISYILNLEEEIENSQPPRLTSADCEDVSDAYQERLEYNWWLDEKEEELRALKEALTEEELKEYLTWKQEPQDPCYE